MSSPNRDTKALPLARESLEALADRLIGSGLTPEEYAARHGRCIYCCSLHRYRYRNAEAEAWVHRLAEILLTPGLVEHYEEQFLTPEELEQAPREEPEEAP